jgi:uncharacterized protein
MSRTPGLLLPAAQRIATPWKNGGGLTREVSVAPAGAGLADFDWRVSTAEVRTSGPFSAFAGIDRTLCVLEGTLDLLVEGREPVSLMPGSAPYAFPGDVPASGAPRGAVAVDLNVMTRRAGWRAQVTRLDAAELAPAPHPRLLFALAALTIAGDGVELALARHDALQLGRPAPRCSVRGSCYLIEILPVAAAATGFTS